MALGTGKETAAQQGKIDNYYLLIIGIDHYQKDISKLDNAVADAKKVAGALTQYRFDEPLSFYPPYDLSVSKSIALYEEKATLGNIMRALDAIHKQIGENDALLIYFAGHGVRKQASDDYYLIAADSTYSEDWTYVDVTRMYANFKDYPASKKCRHLLLILDSCYAGRALEGDPKRKSGFFSRDIITSCLENQEAYDGKPGGHGSVFANEFVALLNDNSRIFLPLDDMYSRLRNKFDSSGDKQHSAQKLDRGPIPDINFGSSSFIFEKTDAERPPIKYLRNSLIEDPNFRKQRDSLSETYLTKKNKLNIITIQGNSFNVQYVVSKVIFRWLNINGSLPVNPEISYIEHFIKIDKADSIWDKLYCQIADDKRKLLNQKEVIFKYYFEKLRSDEGHCGKLPNVILPIGFEVGGPELFKSLEKFCVEFSELFFQQMAELEGTVKHKYGKMFIIICDQRHNDECSHSDLMKNILGKAFNFMPIKAVEQIRFNVIREWVMKFTEEDLYKKLQLLKGEEGLLQFCGDEEFKMFYEDFVEKLCIYFEYSHDDAAELNSSLYGFNNKSLI